jgi:hypothetical protein
MMEKSFLDIAVKNAGVSKLYGYRVVAGRIHRSWSEEDGRGARKRGRLSMSGHLGCPSREQL